MVLIFDVSMLVEVVLRDCSCGTGFGGWWKLLLEIVFVGKRIGGRS